ncbi:hypothetical protein [Legionella waltersii]|uniref:Uncharacterized protein n=1 Tax=Legionella waltersii TaxID=66969 RepID=A0A0W1A0U9_9GAMM|nr:hypothetical protein [Legionella waltersii]KTD74971.1 hypothetical protein Lwal_3012 [Legionella waltersii]SNV08399.1 Uncharacterised protein [Legionella waltersii]
MYTADEIEKKATDWFFVKRLLEESPESRPLLAAHIQSHSNHFLKDWFTLETAKNTFPELMDYLMDFVIQGKNQYLRSWFEISRAKELFPGLTDYLMDFVIQGKNQYLRSWFDISRAKELFPGLTDYLMDFVSQNKDQFLRNWGDVSDAKRVLPGLTDYLIDFVSQNKDQFLAKEYNREQAIRILPTGMQKLGLENPTESTPKVTLSRPISIKFFEDNSASSSYPKPDAMHHGKDTGVYSRYTEREILQAAQESDDNRAKLYLNPHFRAIISDDNRDQMVLNLISDGHLSYREPGYVPEKPKDLSIDASAEDTLDDLIEKIESGTIDWDTLDAIQARLPKP